MGEYFHYINRSKQMYFSVGDCGGGDKFSSIGRHLSARAFSLLLTRSHNWQKKFAYTWMGTWIGDRVECIGDCGSLQEEYFHYKVVTANVLIMLCQIDGPTELAETSKFNDGLFLQLAHLVFLKRLPAMERTFELTFGKNWSKRYQDIYHKMTWFQVYAPLD